MQDRLPFVRGTYQENAPLGAVGWFRCGGRAEVLYKPADREDLMQFLAGCPSDIPITVLGVMSNTIIRDGGVPGVVIRLGREFTEIDADEEGNFYAGAMALDLNVANRAAELGFGGLAFLSGIPGTIGGALRMNAGAYENETKDMLIEADVLDRNGVLHHLTPDQMGMSYRHNSLDEGYIFLGARFKRQEENPDLIREQIAEIRARREASQPIREKTGGSTFANPAPEQLALAGLPMETRAWQLIDQAGCRGLMVGGAQMSEKHCNFMINTGNATASDLEKLGDTVRRRVQDKTGIGLRWEIRRIGAYDHNLEDYA